MALLFAYGSNLDIKQMTRRCGVEPRFISVGYLPEHRLVFTQYYEPWGGGVADVVEAPNSQVWGAIYEVSPESLEFLDVYEGCYGEDSGKCTRDYPEDYKRTLHTIITPSGQDYTAWVYSVLRKDGDFIPPSQRYMNIIKEAAKAFDFPQTYRSYLDSVKTVNT